MIDWLKWQRLWGSLMRRAGKRRNTKFIRKDN